MLKEPEYAGYPDHFLMPTAKAEKRQYQHLKAQTMDENEDVQSILATM